MISFRRRIASLRLADMENCPGAVERMHPEIAERKSVQDCQKAKLRVLRMAFQAGSQYGPDRGLIPPLTLQVPPAQVGRAYGDMRLPLLVRGHPFYKLYPGLADICVLWYLGTRPILPLVRRKIGQAWTERLLVNIFWYYHIIGKPPEEDEFNPAYGKRLVFYVSRRRLRDGLRRKSVS